VKNLTFLRLKTETIFLSRPKSFLESFCARSAALCHLPEVAWKLVPESRTPAILQPKTSETEAVLTSESIGPIWLTSCMVEILPSPQLESSTLL
jgi:hypothetical protein